MSRWVRWRLTVPALTTLALLAAPLTAVSANGVTAASSVGASVADPTGSVIVRARPGRRDAAAAAVRSAGGTVGRDLTIVTGFAARLPASAARRLSADRSIAAVTPDTAVRFSSIVSDATLPTVAGNYPASTGASAVWAKTTRGAGVTVAVIDTGIAQVDDLAGRVIAGPDFSGEHDSLADSYGHGTVMAGIIAGDGASSAGDPGGAYVGMAPAADVVSVKVAGRNGATDVSTVLAAMQWVGSHAAAYHIRAVNLSWGTPSRQSTVVDPLNLAVQRLWLSGVAVVAAAGNSGPAAGTIAKPGDDPLAISVGAFNDRQDGLLGNDQVPAWSSRGPTAAGLAKPDLVAPGRTLVSTRSPGSYIDTTFPDARIGSAYIRGSGTSQATAAVTGAVALLLAARPGLTPDQVKYALTATARPIGGVSPTLQGKGRLWLPTALTLRVGSAPVQHSTATGLGSIEGSRGGRHVETTCLGSSALTRIEGEIDALCLPWDADQWSGEEWSADSWTADSWTADSWTADSWTSGFLTAFWGLRTPWWHHVPGEAAETAPQQSRPMSTMAAREDKGR